MLFHSFMHTIDKYNSHGGGIFQCIGSCWTRCWDKIRFGTEMAPDYRYQMIKIIAAYNPWPKNIWEFKSTGPTGIKLAQWWMIVKTTESPLINEYLFGQNKLPNSSSEQRPALMYESLCHLSRPQGPYRQQPNPSLTSGQLPPATLPRLWSIFHHKWYEIPGLLLMKCRQPLRWPDNGPETSIWASPGWRPTDINKLNNECKMSRPPPIKSLMVSGSNWCSWAHYWFSFNARPAGGSSGGRVRLTTLSASARQW